MENRLTQEMMEALAQPFAASVIKWKPAATNAEKTRGLALAYVDLRHYIDRLNAVAGPDWSDDYEVLSIDGKAVVVCRLSVSGVRRADLGECDFNDQNALTVAAAQGFKRSCVKFGLGAHLYKLPRLWVEYDAERRRFTDAALAQLQRAVSSGNGAGGNGNVLIPAGPHAGKPLSWLVSNDRPYLERIAADAQDVVLREAARALLN